MHKSWFLVPAVASAAVLFMASASAPQGAAPGNSYWTKLAPHVGKSFYLTPEWNVATEKARTSAVPDGGLEFKLAALGDDFACFENHDQRVCVPLAALRVVLRK